MSFVKWKFNCNWSYYKKLCCREGAKLCCLAQSYLYGDNVKNKDKYFAM